MRYILPTICGLMVSFSGKFSFDSDPIHTMIMFGLGYIIGYLIYMDSQWER